MAETGEPAPSSWSAFGLTARKRTMVRRTAHAPTAQERAAQEISERQEASARSRKALADATSSFKASDDTAKLRDWSGLLRAY